MDEVLNNFIKQQLYDELSNAEIIPYNGSVWFIDREEKYWYFELEKNGNLYWRYSFFNNFFKIFSMEPNQFEPIISEWVEEVLNHKVSTTELELRVKFPMVEEVLNHKVSTTFTCLLFPANREEEVVLHKVYTTEGKRKWSGPQLEEVLNHKVSTTSTHADGTLVQVEEVLNHKVSTTIPVNLGMGQRVKYVLNRKVETTKSFGAPKHFQVDKVLNENPTE